MNGDVVDAQCEEGDKKVSKTNRTAVMILSALLAVASALYVHIPHNWMET